MQRSSPTIAAALLTAVAVTVAVAVAPVPALALTADPQWIDTWSASMDSAGPPLKLQSVMASFTLLALRPAVATQPAPQIPGTKWSTNDMARPQPPDVTPGISECQGSPPPSDAIVLFDGHDLSHWTGDNLDQWAVKDGLMVTIGQRSGHLLSKEHFGDAQVHVEFRSQPEAMSQANSQFRSNSGVFLMDLYEVQVLGSYHSPTYADGTAAAVYGQWPPLANASLPPGRWQCYDILFRAPRFRDGRLAQAGDVTVLHNGVLAQLATPILGPTSQHPDFAHYQPHADELPLGLQLHGDGISAVPYRNIWVRRLQVNRP